MGSVRGSVAVETTRSSGCCGSYSWRCPTLTVPLRGVDLPILIMCSAVAFTEVIVGPQDEGWGVIWLVLLVLLFNAFQKELQELVPPS